jgi:hypothetical protein
MTSKKRYPPDHPAMWSRCPACQRLAHWGECVSDTDDFERFYDSIGRGSYADEGEALAKWEDEQ